MPSGLCSYWLCAPGRCWGVRSSHDQHVSISQEAEAQSWCGGDVRHPSALPWMLVHIGRLNFHQGGDFSLEEGEGRRGPWLGGRRRGIDGWVKALKDRGRDEGPARFQWIQIVEREMVKWKTLPRRPGKCRVGRDSPLKIGLFRSGSGGFPGNLPRQSPLPCRDTTEAVEEVGYSRHARACKRMHSSSRSVRHVCNYMDRRRKMKKCTKAGFDFVLFIAKRPPEEFPTTSPTSL
jgi:hypothetical protein